MKIYSSIKIVQHQFSVKISIHINCKFPVYQTMWKTKQIYHKYLIADLKT